MDGCDYSFEIIIVITVPLKEHITETIFFVVVEANVLIAKELLKQWMTARSPVKLNTLSLKEWMTATLSVTKTDIKNSSWQMFYKIGVLKYFAKFTGKHLYWSLFFNKVAGIRPATLLKRDSNTGVFLRILNFSEHLFSQNTYGGCF